MTHPDAETLALLALGESASATDRLHVAGCAECRAVVDRYARVVTAARADEGPLDVPDPRVWAGIAAELGLGAAASPAPALRPVLPRRRRRLVLAAVAAVAAAAVIGTVSLGLLNGSRTERLASATLRALPGWSGSSGTAVLERLPDGTRVVRVRTDVRAGATTDHEVWLMTEGATRLVALGVLDGSSGTFTVPAGVDLGAFRLVDVSDEPRDGDPAHSGDSIVRGALRS